MKGSNSPPPAPDPNATAAAQYQYSTQAAEKSAALSAVDTSGPFGTTTYKRDANGDPTSQTTTLNPASQGIYNTQQGIGQSLDSTALNRLSGVDQSAFSMAGLNYNPSSINLGNMPMWSAQGFGNSSSPVSGQMYSGAYGTAGTPGSAGDAGASAGATAGGGASTGAGAAAAGAAGSSSMPYDPRSYGNINMYNNNVGQAVMQQGLNNLQPQWDQQKEQLDQSIADRGLPIDGAAATTLQGNFQRGEDTAMQNLSDSATQASSAATAQQIGVEQGLNSAAFGQSLQAAQQQQSQYQTQLGNMSNNFQQQLNDSLTQRNQSLNEAESILQGSPSIGIPNAPATPTTNIQAPNYAGIVASNYQQQMQQYTAQNAANNSMWNGVLGIGKAALPYSGLGSSGGSAMSWAPTVLAA